MPSPIDELLSASGDIAYDWDMQADKISWLGPCHALFKTGAPADSQALYSALFSDDRQIVFDGESGVINRQFRIIGSENNVIWVHERGLNESDSCKRPLRQRGVWRIIEPPSRGLSRAEAQHRDGLTGCFKRHALQAQLARAIDSAKSANRIGAYFVVNIDKMSFVNEAVGMDGGDEVLRGVAMRLMKIIPSRAVLGRVGGDLFGVLLPEPLGNDLPSLAERVISDFHHAPLMVANAPLHITVSSGGVRVPFVAKNANEAMIYAEQALHMARQRGRNTFVEYFENPQRVQENRQMLELFEKIKRAFKAKSFRLAYQPLVETATSLPACYEALVRMFDDAGNPIAAAHFVPTIEHMGLADELDTLVLDMAVQDMEADPKLKVAINVSGYTASQPDWLRYTKRVLEARPEIAKRLTIEITETAFVVDIKEMRRFVDMLKGLGVRVALDDFGAGSTSIRYLRELGVSFMKIDKDLLKDVLVNREQQHLVMALNDLAHGLGIQTVAEGVETEEVANWLRTAKVDFMQGYYFGKPTIGRP